MEDVLKNSQHLVLYFFIPFHLLSPLTLSLQVTETANQLHYLFPFYLVFTDPQFLVGYLDFSYPLLYFSVSFVVGWGCMGKFWKMNRCGKYTFWFVPCRGNVLSLFLTTLDHVAEGKTLRMAEQQGGRIPSPWRLDASPSALYYEHPDCYMK